MSLFSFAAVILFSCLIVSSIMSYCSVQIISSDDNQSIVISYSDNNKTSNLQLFLDFTKFYVTYLLISGAIIILGRILATLI